ncbi:hypothetical protein Vretimale_18143 [Volvox reticuliferus]|uniref:Uncharacterized protein n=1 Tax=Volvox reticuliferus TaxID=1737510 RepID=A0A8J4LYJ5_9CHLO|nr:hypothetical protein Vretifemale_17771 [Volvox reticuliferus]GIM15231.1 hypothetical protein Vretimale_18143 [Volvox reticuliferus]
MATQQLKSSITLGLRFITYLVGHTITFRFTAAAQPRTTEMPCLNGSRLDAQLAAAALTLLVLLCACARGADAGRKHSSSPPPPPGPPKEICGRTIVVTEVFNPAGWVTPAGINFTIQDLSPLFGYQLGFTDDAFLGSGTSNLSDPVGKVTSVCYYQNPVTSYCTTTLSFGSFGDITSVGFFIDRTGAKFTNAIVGGTGIFTGAQGTASIDILRGGESWSITIGLLKAPKCT